MLSKTFAKLVGVAALAAAIALPAVASAFNTAVPPYAVPITSDYSVKALLSMGDRVPETSNPALEYQMVGIPDGLGAHPNSDGTASVFMNHELTAPTLSEPTIGQPRNRGAFVSRYMVDANGDILAGERAYDTVFNEDTLVGPAAQEDNATRAFARFCTGSIAGPAEGFDRYIYFTNEEDEGSSTFDGMGGVTVAIFDNEIHALPEMGHFSKENTLVMRGTGQQTVVLSLEDGPTTPDSQLYMYVGWKDNSPGASVLAKNGLINGKLYVFAAKNHNIHTEGDFADGTITGRWVEVPNAESVNAAQLEAFADNARALGFVRIEDGAFSKTSNADFFFVTTGGNKGIGNELGRLYHLKLNSGKPLNDAVLKVVYNADQVITAGGDIAISPDNLDVSKDYLMIQEDGTTQSRAVMAAKGRDGSIWRFDLNRTPGSTKVQVSSAKRVVELDPSGRDGVAVGPGIWETSGIIGTTELFGEGSWLFDVQAHSPTTAPAPNTVEDGQLLLMIHQS